MIVPTVGRVVWVIRPDAAVNIDQPEVGFITYVRNNRLINVVGFNSIGVPFTSTSLRLLQDDDKKPGGDFAVWMPYQKGQAAEYEALEAKTGS